MLDSARIDQRISAFAVGCGYSSPSFCRTPRSVLGGSLCYPLFVSGCRRLKYDANPRLQRVRDAAQLLLRGLEKTSRHLRPVPQSRKADLSKARTSQTYNDSASAFQDSGRVVIPGCYPRFVFALASIQSFLQIDLAETQRVAYHRNRAETHGGACGQERRGERFL
jgi:hypothetical protein